MKILTTDLIRRSEESAVKSGAFSLRDLMVRAGKAAAEIIMQKYDCRNKKITVVCGRGNNGGDGFVMARLIADMGARVFVTLPCGAPKSGIALEEYAKIAHSKITFIDTDDERISDRYDAVVDAVFGTAAL